MSASEYPLLAMYLSQTSPYSLLCLCCLFNSLYCAALLYLKFVVMFWNGIRTYIHTRHTNTAFCYGQIIAVNTMSLCQTTCYVSDVRLSTHRMVSLHVERFRQFTI